MERMDESLELFEYQTGLKIHVKHLNRHISKKNREPTSEDVRKLEKLMPMDLFLYKYAKQLFERRWQMYLNAKNGEINPLPPVNITLSKLPKIIDGCKSTSHYLKCPDDAYRFVENSNEWYGKKDNCCSCLAKWYSLKLKSYHQKDTHRI